MRETREFPHVGIYMLLAGFHMAWACPRFQNTNIAAQRPQNSEGTQQPRDVICLFGSLGYVLTAGRTPATTSHGQLLLRSTTAIGEV
jgi:hypothetical protein